MPGRRESAEVIEADRVDVREQGPDAVDAKAIAARGKRVPVVDGIAPELPLGAEIVRRHAGNHARPALVVEQEKLRIGPHVARVRRDEKGQIADQTHASSAGVFLQARALAEQEELAEADLVDFSREIPARPIERGRRPLDELRRPLEIRRASVSLLERAEQGVVVQPVGLRLAELLERRPPAIGLVAKWKFSLHIARRQSRPERKFKLVPLFCRGPILGLLPVHHRYSDVCWYQHSLV